MLNGGALNGAMLTGGAGPVVAVGSQDTIALSTLPTRIPGIVAAPSAKVMGVSAQTPALRAGHLNTDHWAVMSGGCAGDALYLSSSDARITFGQSAAYQQLYDKFFWQAQEYAQSNGFLYKMASLRTSVGSDYFQLDTGVRANIESHTSLSEFEVAYAGRSMGTVGIYVQYHVGDVVAPPTPNGFAYWCKESGSSMYGPTASMAAEPVLPTILGATVTVADAEFEGSLTWECVDEGFQPTTEIATWQCLGPAPPMLAAHTADGTKSDAVAVSIDLRTNVSALNGEASVYAAQGFTMHEFDEATATLFMRELYQPRTGETLTGYGVYKSNDATKGWDLVATVDEAEPVIVSLRDPAFGAGLHELALQPIVTSPQGLVGEIYIGAFWLSQMTIDSYDYSGSGRVWPVSLERQTAGVRWPI